MIQQSPLVKIALPVPLYDRLKRAAELTHRSVEDVLATTVNAALPPDPNLPPDLADDLAVLALLSDDALWAAAESSLSPAWQTRLEQLSSVADNRSLTAAEFSELSQLLEQYDRSVLRWRTRHINAGRTDTTYHCIELKPFPKVPDLVGPGTTRWKWVEQDEKAWFRCPEGCCLIQE